MKVTFLCPHLRIAGGVRAVLIHADRLARRGHDVTLLVPARGGLRAWWRNRRARGPEWMPGLQARVQWVPEWSPACIPDGDAVVATSWRSVEAVAAAPASAGRQFYFIQHYESLYHGEAARVDATYRSSLRKVVISTWLADVMAERFDSPAAVIVTPVDPALFRPVAVADDSVLRVLMLFHDYPWKGTADGIEAFQRVRALHPEAILVGFGVKAPKQALPFAEFHENLPQERLAWLYSRCPIFLCPSWDEGLGMPSMEAMACGAALCTYDNGGCRDYAIDGRTAVVAPRRDLDALARGLGRLLEDAELRGRLGREGQDFVRTQFDWERATARLESVLAAR